MKLLKKYVRRWAWKAWNRSIGLYTARTGRMFPPAGSLAHRVETGLYGLYRWAAR